MKRALMLLVILCSGCAAKKPVALLPPPPPTPPTQNQPKQHSVSLTWNEAMGATGYNIYRSDTLNGKPIKLNGQVITGTTYEDKDVAPKRTYYYFVSSVNSKGESSLSNMAKATIPE